MSKKKIIVCSDAEHSTIIAALRHYQQQEMTEESKRCEFLSDIATNGGQHEGLDSEEVNELVMSINFAPEKDEVTQALKDNGYTLGDVITAYQVDESNPYVKGALEKNEEGEMQLDCPTVVSEGDDEGAYVMAWVWVSDEEAGITHVCEEAP